MSASAVAVSWAGYISNMLADAGLSLPAIISNAPLGLDADKHLVLTGSLVNLPAIFIVVALGAVCYIGVRQSALINNIMVITKCAVIVLFIVVGVKYIDPSNYSPYIPANSGEFGHFGWSGVFQGAAIIFFSYVGFDTASTTALEARNPQRDVPWGIIGSLIISTVLYIAMAAVMTGMVTYTKLNVDAPVAVALDVHPQLQWMGWLIKLGAVIGMTSIVLMSLLGQPRIFLAMADDGLLPPVMKKCHPVYRTPHVATMVTIVGAALFAGLFPLDVLGELVSIGILLAFAVVCLGVLVLRRTQPDRPRPFKVPIAPVFCVTGALICGGLTLALPSGTWWRLVLWSILGFSIYAFYGFSHSKLRSTT
jgi:APA family basic amino acid/polyamine antiporter